MTVPSVARPRYHFTPPEDWLNDPNGLVFFEGEYHLFYQHRWPRWWGHAVSRDLVRWEHLPPALDPDEHGSIYSGSAVVDRNNTSGFFDGQDGQGGLVAIFTHNGDRQRQSLAFSRDRGRTWIKYAKNPVLEYPSGNFRDPKVFRHEPTARWVMVVTIGCEVAFFVSPNLREWELASRFGGGVWDDAVVWECPDLFELPLQKGDSRWVLVTSRLTGDNFSGGFGICDTQYFVGSFDGRTFTPAPNVPNPRPLGAGPDDYATVSFSDLPFNRRVVIGWLNHWGYAHWLPHAEWEGMLSVPRELSLHNGKDGPRLHQQPVEELKRRRGKTYAFPPTLLRAGERLRGLPSLVSAEIVLEAEVSPDARLQIAVRAGDGEHTDIVFDAAAQTLRLDRRNSGEAGFYPDFAGVRDVVLEETASRLRLHIFIDSGSVEVFAGDGEAYLSGLIFPSPASDGIQISVPQGEVRFQTLELFEVD